MKKVMVFGVFDGIHEGHRAMLKEAKKYGEFLVVAVTPDEIVAQLKGHAPKRCLDDRLTDLRKETGVDEVTAGDRTLGSWSVIKKYQPEIIATGYDQKKMKKDLEKKLPQLGYRPQIVTLQAFEPNKYKSSLLNK